VPQRQANGNGAPDLGRPDLSKLTLAEAAEAAIRFLGGTAESAELRAFLVEAGKLPPSRNSYGYLLKILRDKQDRFVKVEKGTWGLVEDN
jgi:hypothetical protein